MVAGCDLLCMTLNETSTGTQIDHFDLLDQSQLDDTIVAVDATSGAGVVPVDFTKVDLCFFSLQKAFASEGGLWVGIINPKG